MGKLVDGVWVSDSWTSKDGRFRRAPSVFRCEGVETTGTTVPSVQPGRYWLFVSLACPWAHRTLVARALLRIGDDVLPITVVDPVMLDDGWEFSEEFPDTQGGRRFLRDVYVQADRHYTGRVTVPVLYDTHTDTIVCNESADVLRILNRDFRGHADTALDLYPEPLRAEIDAVNDRVYKTFNNGVYKAGFAGTQEAYEEAIGPLFETMAWLDDRLADRKWMMGDRVTEVDIRAFTTAIRFDPIYYTHFKCSVKRLADHENLWRWVRDFLALEGVAATVDVEHAKRHYFASHRMLNPRGIVPLGPELDYTPDR